MLYSLHFPTPLFNSEQFVMRNKQFSWRLLVFATVCVMLSGWMFASDATAQTAWEFRAPMPTPRAGAAVTVLNGNIYVIGGEDNDGNALSTVEVYDPELNTWTTQLSSQRSRKHAAALTHQGAIFLMGGHGNTSPTKSVEVFLPHEEGAGFDCEDDEDGNKDDVCWIFIDDFEKSREGLSAVELDGTVYALGGADDEGDLLKTVEYYDERDKEWRIFESWEQQPPRFNFATVAVNDSAFSIGGISSFGPLSLVQRYHESAGQENRASMPTARGGIGAAAVDNFIYVAGGREVNNQLTSRVDILDVALNSWQPAPPLFTPREHAAVVAVGTKIFVIGGMGDNGNVLNSVEMLDLGDIPAVPTLVSPANGATGQPLDLTLNWATEDGATSRIQISTDENFSIVLLAESNLTTSDFNYTDAEPATTYFWRVRAENASGSSAWTAPFQFSTQTDPPEVPLLLSPADGTVDISDLVTFTWQPQAGATFELQAAIDESFTTLVVDEINLSEAQYELTGLEASSVYYWRLRARNAAGVSNWSAVYSFTTAGNLPGVPVLTGPADGTLDISDAVTLTWEVAPGATSRLQILTDESSSSIVLDVAGIAGGSYEYTDLDASTVYYWRVRAVNDTGASDWSETFHFTTAGNLPAPPVLTAPADSTADLPYSLALRWQAETGARVDMQLAVDGAFSSIVVAVTGVSADSFQVTGLKPATEYFWRARAVNEVGASAWSGAARFTTRLNPPAAPILLMPLNGALDIARDLMLRWEAGGDHYDLQVATDEQFANLLVDEAEIDSAFFALSELSPFTTYFWRVRSMNAAGEGDWSAIYQFTTVNNVATEDAALPDMLELHENYPNPFASQTTIVFKVEGSTSPVQLAIYDLLGRPVTMLVDGVMPTGTHQVIWDGSTDVGIQVKSGLYIYQLRQGERHIERKMMIIR